ncbi:MAG: hypothetical protein IK052_03965 [Bacteroidales bacterium]|nr:hypothetical protein [Bacteroidales bacterium]
MLPILSCRRESPNLPDPVLQVSLYIPGSTITKAVTGTVDPLEEELKITSLQIWAFMAADGRLITYRSFDEDIDRSGVSNSNITRFGLPISQGMFKLLTTDPRPKVDVYAVANVASATSATLGAGTTRDELDAVIISEIGGNSPLTMAVPEAGLPMSGVLKGTDVSGGYPVLNVTTVKSLKLLRAVSKIRFVFCQQGISASGDTPAVPGNADCEILGIAFDGTSGGKDCQIGDSELLFTDKSFDLGAAPAYTPLSQAITGSPLIPNSNISVVEDPEVLFFRGFGNETESAQHYEERLDAAVAAASQVGPIYLRETDKTISGTITYRISSQGEPLTARFSMEDAGLSRNHTWIVFASFMEETMKLSLRTVVLPWEWTMIRTSFTEGTVNVVRRFTVFDTPVPSFKKVQTTDGFYDVDFWHTIEVEGVEQENVIEGDIIISTPVGGTLHVVPIPGKDGGVPISDAITVTPSQATIYPNMANDGGRVEDCRIPIAIRCNPSHYATPGLEGNYIDLHFCVETQDGRYIDLGTESIDYYRFRLTESWNQ